MDAEPQVEVDVVVDAPLERVWEYLMDIEKIPEFHPRVDEVKLLSGAARKDEGVSYQCEIHHGLGKGTCVERVEEVVPLHSFRTTIPEDSWGLSDLFEHYVVDTTVSAVSPSATRIAIAQRYEPTTLKARLLNLIVRPRARRQTRDLLEAIKRALEQEGR